MWFKLRGIYDASFVSTHCWSSIFCHWSPSERCPWDLLNESQFRMLKKCSTKWDCLVYEMLYIRTIRPNLNTQSDPLGPNSLFDFQCLLIYSSLQYIYSISLFYFHLIMTFWKRRNVVLCFIIFYRRFLLSNVLPNLYLFKYYWWQA